MQVSCKIDRRPNELILPIMVQDRWNLAHLTGGGMMNTVLWSGRVTLNICDEGWFFLWNGTIWQSAGLWFLCQSLCYMLWWYCMNVETENTHPYTYFSQYIHIVFFYREYVKINDVFWFRLNCATTWFAQRNSIGDIFTLQAFFVAAESASQQREEALQRPRWLPNYIQWVSRGHLVAMTGISTEEARLL